MTITQWTGNPAARCATRFGSKARISLRWSALAPMFYVHNWSGPDSPLFQPGRLQRTGH